MTHFTTTHVLMRGPQGALNRTLPVINPALDLNRRQINLPTCSCHRRVGLDDLKEQRRLAPGDPLLDHSRPTRSSAFALERTNTGTGTQRVDTQASLMSRSRGEGDLHRHKVVRSLVIVCGKIGISRCVPDTNTRIRYSNKHCNSRKYLGTEWQNEQI